MDKALEQVIEAVRQASPQLWAAAQSKVNADIMVAHFWAWGGLGILVSGLALFVISAYVEGNSFDASIGLALSGAVCVLGGLVIAGVNWTNYIQITAARDWYAIEALSKLSPLK